MSGGDARQPMPWGAGQVIHFTEVASTMDEAHRCAESGAPAGTVILADRQVRARGRAGRRWTSDAGDGVWMTLIERSIDPLALSVVSLRVGLALCEGLAPWVDGALHLKWPNDVYGDAGKLAGILVETRWRGAVPDWIAIGVGINLRLPTGIPGADALRVGVGRDDVVSRVVPLLRRAVAQPGHLSDDEVAAWDARDMTRGRLLQEPAVGRADGITADGSLRVLGEGGVLGLYRSGSLRYSDAS